VATRADFEAYQQHFGPTCLFVNGLGPTESTLSLQFVADHSTKIIGQTVPVGYPVEHTEITLLNQDGKETEVYGEIAIRSPYVAIGYWHQPELTQTMFDPATEPGSARRYRTGDMGRRRSDGSLEFMGRKDTQVKIRGHRIELGEIESVLVGNPEVGKAVVVCHEETKGETVLVAYVVPAQEGDVFRSKLRSYLREHLPDYMVPNAYVQLEALPLTPNGKIDRKALPLPDAAQENLDVTFVAPRTPIEAAIAEIWQDVLKLERVGIHDNFFELGGHSLLATQVVARVRESLHIDLKLRHFFEVPTLKELAGTVEILQNSTQNRESFTYNTGEDRSEILL
jgi:acyl carrier protein